MGFGEEVEQTRYMGNCFLADFRLGEEDIISPWALFFAAIQRGTNFLLIYSVNLFVLGNTIKIRINL